MKKKLLVFLLMGIFILYPFICSFGQSSASSQTLTQGSEHPAISLGNTAWMMIASALVLLMTIPGLALFYGGLVRRKNILNILMQCFIMVAIISVEWVIVGYSLTFGSC